jgi:hypothetical protein
VLFDKCPVDILAKLLLSSSFSRSYCVMDRFSYTEQNISQLFDIEQQLYVELLHMYQPHIL